MLLGVRSASITIFSASARKFATLRFNLLRTRDLSSCSSWFTVAFISTELHAGPEIALTRPVNFNVDWLGSCYTLSSLRYVSTTSQKGNIYNIYHVSSDCKEHITTDLRAELALAPRLNEGHRTINMASPAFVGLLCCN